MKAAVLHAFGRAPRWEEFSPPVPDDGEELIEVTAAPLNNIDRVRADGSHYSVRSGQYAPGGRARRARGDRRGSAPRRPAGALRFPVRLHGPVLGGQQADDVPHPRWSR